MVTDLSTYWATAFLTCGVGLLPKRQKKRRELQEVNQCLRHYHPQLRRYWPIPGNFIFICDPHEDSRQLWMKRQEDCDLLALSAIILLVYQVDKWVK